MYGKQVSAGQENASTDNKKKKKKFERKKQQKAYKIKILLKHIIKRDKNELDVNF